MLILEKLYALLRRFALPAVVISLALGIGIGLFCGWMVWPVMWYNTDPSDMRAQHQIDYVVMTADSLAVTGNVEQARRRLLELTDDDTSWEQVGALVRQVAADRERAGEKDVALRVKRLGDDLGIPANPQAKFEAPRKRIAPTPRWAIALLVGFAFLLLIITGAVWLLTRPNRAAAAQAAATAQTAPSVAPPPRISPVPEPPLSDAPWDTEESAAEPEVEEPPPSPPFQDSAALRPSTQPARQGEVEQWLPLAQPPTASPKPSAAKRPTGVLDSFEAKYSLGENDFDRQFDIHLPDDTFLGQCGIFNADVLDEIGGVQRFSAFEIWLFDKDDPRQLSKFLLSEYAYQNQEMRDKFAAKGEVVLAKEGLTVTLQSENLHVSATITGMSYAEDARFWHGVFSSLNVRFVAALVS